MAPQIEAVYAHVEGLLGEEFCERLYATLDEVLAKLEPPAGRRPVRNSSPRAARGA